MPAPVVMIGRDARVKIGLVALTLACAIALVAKCQLVFPAADLWRPLGLVALLSAVAVFYKRFRAVPKFVSCLAALIFLVMFCSGFVVLMYAIAATNRPLVDASLARADQSLGFHLPALMAWTGAHPWLNGWLRRAYDTILPQTIVVIAVLSFCGDAPALEKFVLRFMVCALVTVALFYWFPAKGPFTVYGFAPTQDQARTLQHLEAMRSGQRKLVTWREAEGLITFPSFHVVWALLLALAFRGRRWLFGCSLALNAAVIFSTLSTGWHYLTDVLGGFAVCAAVLAILHPLEKWLYAAPADPAPKTPLRNLLS
jgi:membrane-associated phospholipid phosphatase